MSGKFLWSSSQNKNRLIFKGKIRFLNCFANNRHNNSQLAISAISSKPLCSLKQMHLQWEDQLPHYEKATALIENDLCILNNKMSVVSPVCAALLTTFFCLPLIVCGNTGLSTLSPASSSRGKDRGKSRKSIFGTAPSRCSTTGEVTPQNRTPGKGNS